VAELRIGRRLGTGKRAEVFEYGDFVVKLYAPGAPKGPAFREAATLALVESLSLPAPAVQGVREIGGRWGIVMGRAEGQSWAEAAQGQPERIPSFLTGMAALHRRIHEHTVQLPHQKERLALNIRRVATLGPARQTRLLDGLAARPDGDRLCHGDFHPWNIIGAIGRATVVDWVDASAGDPAADVCRSYVLMHPSVPDVASAYVDAYAAATGIDRAAILGWLPFVAAARLAEDVPNEADALMAMVGAV
jgi:aminoglycoside phosphotransferase (APT) family kinase protein